MGQITVNHTFEEMSVILLSRPEFIQVGETSIINIKHVKKIRKCKNNRTSNFEFLLVEGHIIPLARDRQKAVFEAIQKLRSELLPENFEEYLVEPPNKSFGNKRR